VGHGRTDFAFEVIGRRKIMQQAFDSKTIFPEGGLSL
jgi:hypothetical protein